MPDLVIETTEIDAPPDACWAAAIDYPAYADWAHDLKQVEVQTRDAEGRGLEVLFRAAGMGRSVGYTLRYDYSDAPHRLAWVLVKGDLVSKLDGYYEFEPVEGDPDRTKVDYRLEVELILPLPGFVKRRTQVKIMDTALGELKARVESARS
jgi:hypothetical protein